MLDDLKFIHQRDKSDALGVAEKQWQQLQYDFSDVSPAGGQNFANVVVGGMGGSALAALFVNHVFDLRVPYEVVRDYQPPSYVGEETLFIASSYSGNTEEALSCLAKAEEAGAKIVVIAAGGKLAEIAEEKNLPLYSLPSGIQPRMAVFYNLAALTQALVTNGLLDQTVIQNLRDTADWLKSHVAKYAADVTTKDNPAKRLAQECVGLSPVIYSSALLSPVAYKWKINFNENAKNAAWCNQFPEFSHNEFLGWSSHPIEKPYRIINLHSSFDHPQIDKRFSASDKLLSGKWPHPINITAEGETLLEQALWLTMLGDFVSLYTALLNNLDPSPVELIEKLKKELT